MSIAASDSTMDSEFPVFKFERNHPTVPSELWNVPAPPEQLYIQGDPNSLEILKRLPEAGLAIVGTRNPQPRTCSFLEKRVCELSPSQLIIVSGMARGIDAIAHAAALRAGLPTIGILGTGIDIPYPQASLPLRKQILKQGGLLVSEFHPGTRGFPSHFLERNRLIAGWSKATWVVEASHRSGALNTAHWARQQDRLCFALPSFPGDPTLSGNQTLIDREHALPFWGIHSLGAAWLELATQGMGAPSRPAKESVQLVRNADAESLCLEVQKLTQSQGSAPVSELLNWAIHGGWSPDRFFTALELGLKNKQIQDYFGNLISTC